MSGQGQAQSDSSQEVQAWDPRDVLRPMSALEARLSNGFLRCHPERWLPGFSARWLPLLNVLACDTRVIEVKPTLALPERTSRCFHGTLGAESLVLAVDGPTAGLIAQEISARTMIGERDAVLVEYFARRFLSAIGLCQTATEKGAVVFHGECSPTDISLAASVRFSFTINSHPGVIVMGIDQGLVDRMDGLWRRQLFSSSRVGATSGMLRAELTQLGVPPQMLSEYLIRGTVVDLELPVSDSVTLRLGTRPFMSARMVDVEGRMGFQVVQGSPLNTIVPEGTSRLSIELASFQVDAETVAELGQVGSVLLANADIGDRVEVMINQERVASARLCVYQDRYAVEII